MCRHSHQMSYNITCSQPPQLWWCFCSVQTQSSKVIQLHVHSPATVVVLLQCADTVTKSHTITCSQPRNCGGASAVCRHSHQKSYNYMFTAPQLWWCFCSVQAQSPKVIQLHIHSPATVVVLLQCADTVTKSHTITCSQPRNCGGASVVCRHSHQKSYNYIFTAPQLWWCFCSVQTQSPKVIQLHVHSPATVVVLLQCADTVTKSHTITCSQPPQL